MPLSMILLASHLVITVADTVPKFDISRGCNAEATSQAEMDACVRDENEARDALQPQWSQFAAPDKLDCIKETSMDGTPSYVELLTCLEMARDARKLPRQ